MSAFGFPSSLPSAAAAAVPAATAPSSSFAFGAPRPATQTASAFVATPPVASAFAAPQPVASAFAAPQSTVSVFGASSAPSPFGASGSSTTSTSSSTSFSGSVFGAIPPSLPAENGSDSDSGVRIDHRGLSREEVGHVGLVHEPPRTANKRQSEWKAFAVNKEMNPVDGHPDGGTTAGATGSDSLVGTPHALPTSPAPAAPPVFNPNPNPTLTPVPSAFNPLGRGGRGSGRAFVRGGRGGAHTSHHILNVFDEDSSSMPPPAPRGIRVPTTSSSHTSTNPLDGHPMVQMFDAFLKKLFDSDAYSRESGVQTYLDKAFFHLQWPLDTPAGCLTRMIEKCIEAKSKFPELRLKLERWAVVFFLGCNVSMLLKHVTSGGGGDENHTWQEVLTTVLVRTNIFCATFVELYLEDKVGFVPFTSVAVVLRRVRASFEAAASVGFFEPTSKAEILINKVVIRETKPALYKPLIAPPETQHQHLIAVTKAAILAEMSSLGQTQEFQQRMDWADSFHKHCPDEVEHRVALYLGDAVVLATYPLGMHSLQRTRLKLAHGLALCPTGHPSAIILARWFAAVSFAAGMIAAPPTTSSSALATAGASSAGTVESLIDTAWYEQYGLQDEFTDAAVALATANIVLYEAHMSQWLPQYTATGIAAMMQFGRVHVRTAIVVRYFCLMGRTTQLSIKGLIEFVGPLPTPYKRVTESYTAFSQLWLMPLLLEKFVNGTVVEDMLLLSKAMPFEYYDLQGV